MSANAASSNENANNARISAEAAKQSETNAALSEASALESKNASAENAAKSQNNASNAKNSADSAKESETKAQEYSNLSQSNANASSESASNAKASEDASKKNADDSAATLQELKDGIASGNFKGEKGDKGDPGAPGKDATVDTTLTHEGEAADAKATGDAISAIKSRQNILIGTETGNPLSVDDAFPAPLCGLTVYGRSTQAGTPTPDAPVPIVSAGDGGSVAVTLSDGKGKTQTLNLPTPNGLPGIPVTSGGNYTDPQGQQWVCDEVDLERGVKVQRIASFVIDAKNAKNIYVTNLYTHVAVAVNARIRAPEETNNSLEVRTNRNLFCEALPWIANAWSSTVNSMGFVEKGMVDFTIENSYLGLDAASTDDERKTALVKYFTAKPCRVVHRIATPIETPLTPAEIAAYKALTVYAPDTVVQAIDGAGLKLEYQRDVNIVIKNLEDAIASMTAT